MSLRGVQLRPDRHCPVYGGADEGRGGKAREVVVGRLSRRKCRLRRRLVSPADGFTQSSSKSTGPLPYTIREKGGIIAGSDGGVGASDMSMICRVYICLRPRLSFALGYIGVSWSVAGWGVKA